MLNIDVLRRSSPIFLVGVCLVMATQAFAGSPLVGARGSNLVGAQGSRAKAGPRTGAVGVFGPSYVIVNDQNARAPAPAANYRPAAPRCHMQTYVDGAGVVHNEGQVCD